MFSLLHAPSSKRCWLINRCARSRFLRARSWRSASLRLPFHQLRISSFSFCSSLLVIPCALYVSIASVYIQYTVTSCTCQPLICLRRLPASVTMLAAFLAVSAAAVIATANIPFLTTTIWLALFLAVCYCFVQAHFVCPLCRLLQCIYIISSVDVPVNLSLHQLHGCAPRLHQLVGKQLRPFEFISAPVNHRPLTCFKEYI